MESADLMDLDAVEADKSSNNEADNLNTWDELAEVGCTPMKLYSKPVQLAISKSPADCRCFTVFLQPMESKPRQRRRAGALRALGYAPPIVQVAPERDRAVVRRIFTTGDGQGAKEESDAKLLICARGT